MATLPQFKQRQIARRSTSDIDRLVRQYKSNVDAITGEYQTAFTGYQAGVTEKMKPFEEQMKTYRESLLPTYESQKNLYKQKLDSYNEVLADLERNPTIERRGTEIVYEPSPVSDPNSIGPTFIPVERSYTYYEQRPIPKFTETAPKAPNIPVAPEIEKFDESEFGKKRVAAESAFKREVGERRAARIGAVSRRATRPLLSGAK